MLEENLGIERMLDHLEKQCGGHGNGLVLVKDGNVTFIKKSVNYTNKQITKKIMNSDFDYCMYHTRIASVSGISDSNCHPYYTKKKDLVLMMNGTEREIGKLAAPIGITDTEMVFRMIRDYDVPVSALQEMSARYIGFKDGKVFICNTSVQCLEFIREKNAFVVASSFPKIIASKQMKVGLWKQGESITERYNYSSYGNNRGTIVYNGGQPRTTTSQRIDIGGANVITREAHKEAVEECRNANDRVGSWLDIIENKDDTEYTDIDMPYYYDGYGGYR